MARKRGTITNVERPNWQPLLDLIGEEVTADFMWMHEVTLSDGTGLHAYKHWYTRRYVHVTAACGTFAYGPGNFYRPVDPAVQLREVIATLPGLWGATERRLQASREAVQRLEGGRDDAG